MSMGTIDSIKHIESGIATGSIKVSRRGSKVRVSGDTYPVGWLLKRDYGARWDPERRNWVIDLNQWVDIDYRNYQIRKINDLLGLSIEYVTE